MAPNRYYTSNAVATTLTAGLSSVTPGTTGNVQVASITGYPVSYPFTLLLDWGTASQEVVTVTQAATGTGPYTYGNCVRGDDGTAAPAHTAPSATVVHGVSARDFSDPQNHLGSSTGVHGVSGALAPLGSPALTGTPTAPTAAALTSSTQVATTAYTDSAVGTETTRAAAAESTNATAITANTTAMALKAPLASPALTGTPTAPTAAALTSSTQVATTAYTDSAVTAAAGAPVLTRAATKTSSYTAAANQIVPCDISGGSFTVTLPSAPAAGTAAAVEITAVSGTGVNALTVACGGTDVLDATGGATSYTLTLQHQSLLLVYGGGVWARVAGRDSYLEVAVNRYGTYYLDQYAGTDDQRMTLAIAAVVAAGGGTVQLSPRTHTFANQWTTTYVSGSSTTALRILGCGVAFNGAWQTTSAATTCTFTYTGAGAACMDFQHNGSIELVGIRFTTANLGVPLFQTTNATPNIHDCVFFGGGAGTTCATDAIVLGSGQNTVGAGDTAKYNAYQGRIYGNFFDGVRRVVLFNPATNSVHVYDNTVSTSCGSSLPFGAAFEVAGGSTKTIVDVQIVNNCIEVMNYPVGIKTFNALCCTLGPNGFYDSTSMHLAAVLMVGGGFNRVKSGYHDDTRTFCIDGTGNSLVENLHQAQRTVWRQPFLFTSPFGTSGYLDGSAQGLRNYDFAGNFASVGTVLDAPNAGGYAAVSLISGNCTQVGDGTTYNGSNWVTSPTAAFAAPADQYVPITSLQIPATSYILNVATPATAWPWGASYAYNLGDIARPPTANSHLYQCTTAGTSGASAPTWPTSGGTVTDGTAVWTDLGTAMTAAFISQAATATAASAVLKFGRIAVSRTLIQFNRFHITTLGGTPSTAADAGAGTGPSGITTVGTDHKFTVNITSGTATATGDMFHTAPAQGWIASAPLFAMTAGNSAAASLMAGGYWLTVSSGIVTANFTTAPTASTAYIFGFVAMG